MHRMGDGIVELGVGGEFAQALAPCPLCDGCDEAGGYALPTGRWVDDNALEEGHG